MYAIFGAGQRITSKYKISRCAVRSLRTVLWLEYWEVAIMSTRSERYSVRPMYAYGFCQSTSSSACTFAARSVPRMEHTRQGEHGGKKGGLGKWTILRATFAGQLLASYWMDQDARDLSDVHLTASSPSTSKYITVQDSSRTVVW